MNVTQPAAAVSRESDEVSIVLYPKRCIDGVPPTGTYDHGAAETGIGSRAHVSPKNRSSEIQIVT